MLSLELWINTLTINRPDMWRQGVGSVHSTESEGGPRNGTRLVVGAGVRVGAGGRRRLIARRVGRDRDRLMRRVQVRHRRQWSSPLTVTRYLYPRYRPQQTEARSSWHHIRAAARRKCPGARTLPPIRGTRLSTHSVTQIRTCHRSLFSGAHAKHDARAAGRHRTTHTTLNRITRKLR